MIKNTDDNQIKHSQTYSKPLFLVGLILMMGVFLVSSVSSASWDNRVIEKGTNPNTGYPNIEIKNWLGAGETLAELSLTEHTATCGIECSSKLEINHRGGVLIDDLEFETLQYNGEWLSQPVRSYQFKYEAELPKYETQCTDLVEVCTPANIANNTLESCYTPQSCSQVQVGTYTGFKNYIIGTEAPSGNYELYLDAEKKPSRTVDWVPTIQGKRLKQLAVWGNISLGDDAEVILNSPTDNNILDTFDITFNASANITGGAYITNISLWANLTGTWLLNETINLFSLITSSITHGVTINTLAYTGTAHTGMAINISASDINLDGITKVGSSTATKGYVGSTPNGVDIGSCTFIGNDCNFSSSLTLSANTDYFVSTDNNGASYDAYYNSASQTFPTNTYFEWYGRVNQLASVIEGYAQEITYLHISIGNSQTSVTETWSKTISDTTIWNVEACDSDGDCGFATSNYTVLLDSTPPTITILSPSGTVDYAIIETTDLNLTVTDTNLEDCWYNYNGTNITIPSCENTTFELELGNYNMTLYANDTVGNLEVQEHLWSYLVLEESQTYDSTVLEGSTNEFSANLTMSSLLRISTVQFNYDDTNYLATSEEYETDRWTISRTQLIPAVDTNTNVTFYWNITFEDGSSQSTRSYNQTITDIGIDDCSLYTHQVFKLEMVDEATQIIINGATGNTSIKVDITFSYSDNSGEVINFSKFYDEINPARVCISEEMGESTMRLDAVIEYVSGERFVEFYNIQDYTINNETQSQNISLYNLKDDEGQEFKITYKGTDFVPVSDLLIQIQRKYVDEGIFKTIEIPMSGTNGYTIAHLVPNDVIYNLIFLKDGLLLDTFTEVIATCQNPDFNDCEINLNALITGQDLISLVQDDDMYSSITYTPSTRTVTATYGIVSGVSASSELSVLLMDNYGTTEVCSDTLNANGGTLSCIVPNTFGNSTIHAKLFIDGDLRRDGIISMAQKPKDLYGGALIFLAIIMLLFIVGIGVQENPMIMGVFLMIGIFILIGLNIIYSTSWIGAGATVLWFIIAIVLIMIKGGNKR